MAAEGKSAAVKGLSKACSYSSVLFQCSFVIGLLNLEVELRRGYAGPHTFEQGGLRPRVAVCLIDFVALLVFEEVVSGLASTNNRAGVAARGMALHRAQASCC